jgi:diguanylate cyclase (GGDEF)-like protein
MAPTPIRILMVEDSAADAELEVRELKRAGLRIDYRLTDTEAGCRQEIERFKPEVILSDFAMPHFDGMSALAAARELCPDTPFIFVSGTLGEDYAIRALKNGATDYVLKTNLVRLPPAIERALSEAAQRKRLSRLSRLRQFSSQINWALVRIRERDELFATISKIAVEIGGLAAARVGTFDEGAVQITWRPWFPAEPEDAAMASFPLTVEGREAGLLEFSGFFDEDQAAVLSELAANVSFALELMAKQERLNYLALYDPLTGLANRALFRERLAQAIASAAEEKSRLALIVTDLDRFKAINDTLGQPVGDAVLKLVAERLTQAAGDNRVARLGGNVFATLIANLASAEEVARRLAKDRVFGPTAQVQQHEIRIGAKRGIAIYPEDGADADTLFRNAEAALKRAKETSERYLFYAPSINARVSEQVELEGRLRKAIDRGELFLHFQPKYDLANQRMVGMEALMRWHGPDGALVSPAKFVPILEQTGLIFEAGQQAMASAARTYRDWRARGLQSPRIAVNVSALQLRRRTFVDDVRVALGGAGADGGGVDIEVTESLLMAEVDESIRKLRELREMGMRMALDDFGTGYSSLAYLSKLPLDTLKIDRSFVHGMTERADNTSIVSAIISLGQALRLKIVAEGVETEAQAQLLRLLRCDEVQGFLFSKPLPAAALEEHLKAL